MEHKFHGKKRSYFFRKKVVNSTQEKEEEVITITASQFRKDGKSIRTAIQIYKQDLEEFLRILQQL